MEKTAIQDNFMQILQDVKKAGANQVAPVKMMTRDTLQSMKETLTCFAITGGKGFLFE